MRDLASGGLASPHATHPEGVRRTANDEQVDLIGAGGRSTYLDHVHAHASGRPLRNPRAMAAVLPSIDSRITTGSITIGLG
jgi:hypothetical protein